MYQKVRTHATLQAEYYDDQRQITNENRQWERYLLLPTIVE